jgi:Transposase and inactivated derivatives
MKFIQGFDRNQIQFFAYEQLISEDNDVRLIDAFVGSLNLGDCGFKIDFVDNGRPAYHPSVLIKLYLYGYLNRIRSSRALEKECSRNIEVMWLLRGLSPDHNTISNFRRDNAKAIRNVFRSTVRLAQNFDLIGGKLLAGDGTKLRAQNSKKNNFNQSKIDKHIAYIDRKLEEYNALLGTEDGDNLNPEQKKDFTENIDKHQERRKKYEALQEQLNSTYEKQISTSDPDSRLLMLRNNITEVSYNVQTTVDSKHSLCIDYKVTNHNDAHAMGNMLRRAKSILNHKEFTVLYDKGYHTGSQLSYADNLGIKTLVAITATASHAPDLNYDIEHFTYNAPEDNYTCPQGQTLSTNGKWYTKDRTSSSVQVKHYKTDKCLSCSVFAKCTKNKAGRLLERSQYQANIDNNARRMEQNKQTYKRRQAIVEHPIGIVKRQWDFYYIMTKKTIKRASGDVGLIFSAFNLRRIFNILDKDTLKAYLRTLAFVFRTTKAYFKLQSAFIFLPRNYSTIFSISQLAA